jgi:N12 class adenine-specific DNA methylase
MGKSFKNKSADDLLQQLGLDKEVIKVETGNNHGGEPAPAPAGGTPEGGTPAGDTTAVNPVNPAPKPVTPVEEPQANDSTKLLKDLKIPEKKNTTPPLSGGSKEPSPPPPAPAFNKSSAISFLKDDYLFNKQRVDPALQGLGYGKLSPVGPLMEQPKPVNPGMPKPSLPGAMQQTLPDDRLLLDITNPKAGSNVLGDYLKTRMQQLDEDFKKTERELNQKYPQKMQVVSAGGDITRMVRENETAYNEEVAQRKQAIAENKRKLELAVNALANIKVVNEAKANATPHERATGKYLDMEKLGRAKRKVMNDPTLEKQERYEAKGIAVDPTIKFNNDKTGLTVAKAAVGDLSDDYETDPDFSDDTIKEDDVNIGRAAIAQQEKNLLNKHPEFVRQQMGKVISDKIYQNKNWLQTMTGAYTITKEDIKKAAKDLGVNENLIKDLKPSDIKSANMFGTFLTDLAVKPGADIGATIGRNFRKHILGQDEDAVDNYYDKLKEKYTGLFADPTDAQAQYGTGSKVDLDPSSDTYLQDVQSNNKSFNWSPTAIANTIASGFGQLSSYGFGAGAAGKLLQGAGLVGKLRIGMEAAEVAAATEKAREVGLVAYGFLSQYDTNYQQAKQMGIENEAMANAYSFVRSLASAYTEKIFPDYKVTDALFSPGSKAGKELIDLIAKKGVKGLVADDVMPLIKDALIQGTKNTGKEILEEEADNAAEYMSIAMFKPEALKDRDFVTDAVQTAVITGIGTILPVGAGEFSQGRHQSYMNKNLFYHVGTNPTPYINAIQDQVDNGALPQAQADKKFAVISKLKDAVETTPEVSPVNGNRIADSDKVDYANNLFHQKLLTDDLQKAKDNDDSVQEKAISKKITELEKKRERILQNADGVDRNGEGDPIIEGDTEASTKHAEDNRKADLEDIDEKIKNLDPAERNYEFKKKNLEQERKQIEDYYDTYLKNISSPQNPNSDEQGNSQEQPGSEGQEPSQGASKKTSEQQAAQSSKGQEDGQLLNNDEGNAQTEDDTIDPEDALPSRFRKKKTAEQAPAANDVKETKQKMQPITDHMATIEMDMSNAGYDISTDYDNQIIVQNKKTGDIVDLEDIPENLHKHVQDYEKATSGLGNYDEQTFQATLAESRKRIQGEDTDYEEVKPKELPASDGKKQYFSNDENVKDIKKPDSVYEVSQDGSLDVINKKKAAGMPEHYLHPYYDIQTHKGADQAPEDFTVLKKPVVSVENGKATVKSKGLITWAKKSNNDKSNSKPVSTGSIDTKEKAKTSVAKPLSEQEQDIIEAIRDEDALPDTLKPALDSDPHAVLKELNDQIEQGDKGGAANNTDTINKMYGTRAVKLARQLAMRNKYGSNSTDNPTTKERLYGAEVLRGEVKDPDWELKKAYSLRALYAFFNERKVSHSDLKAGEEYFSVQKNKLISFTKIDRNNARETVYYNGKTKVPVSIDETFYSKDQYERYGKDVLTVAKALGFGFNNPHLMHDTGKLDVFHSTAQRNLYKQLTRAILETLAPGNMVEDMNLRDVRVTGVFGDKVGGTLATGPRENSMDQRPAGDAVNIDAFRVDKDNLNVYSLLDYYKAGKHEQQTSTPTTTTTAKAETATAAKQDSAEIEKTKQDLAQAKAELKAAMLKARGKLSMNGVIDPEVVAKGVKVMSLYAKLGFQKFGEIMKELASDFGHEFFDKENVDALKGVYSYWRSNLPKEERKNASTEDDVDDFIDNELPNLLNSSDEQIQEVPDSSSESEKEIDLGAEARNVESKAKSVIQKAGTATTNKQRSESIEAIDDAVDDIDRLLTLAGEYNADGSMETEIGDQSSIKAFKKDLTNYSKRLAKLLGYEHDSNKKKKIEYANTNVAPAGGNGSIILWKPNSDYGVYISVPVDRKDYTAGRGYSDDLVIRGILGDSFGGDILWRVTTKDNKFTGLQNRYINKAVTAGEFADLIKKAVDQAENKKIKDFNPSINEDADTNDDGALRQDTKRLPTGESSEDVQSTGEGEQAGGVLPGQGTEVPGTSAVPETKRSGTRSGRGGSVGGSYAATRGTGKNVNNEKRNEELGGETAELPEQKTGEPVVIPDKNGNNFVIPPDYTHERTFNPKKKYADNIAALKVLRDILKEPRHATDKEKDILFKYVGFGGLKEVLLDPDRPWSWVESNKQFIEQVKEVRAVAKELEALGVSDAMSLISASTANAHYTSIPIIRGIYEALKKGGFTGGKVLEPSVGNGHFFGAMPYDLAKVSDLYAVEKDAVTGNIFKLLYPDARTHIGGFEEVPMVKNFNDLVISNIPFGNYKVFDKELNKSSNMALVKSQGKIHNFFFAKGLEQVRPGGLMAFVTSMGVLDSPDNEFLRQHISKTAEFLGAIRLPNTAFKANANTEVATDIVFLRKFNEGEPVSQKHNFINHIFDDVAHYDGKSVEQVRYNEYFKLNPHMIIGTLAAGGLQSREQLTVEPPSGNLDIQAEIAKRASEIFPKKIYTKAVNRASNNEELKRYLVESVTNKKVGSLMVMPDGKIAHVTTIDQDGKAEAAELKSTEPKDKLKSFIDLRDRLNRLYAAELNNEGDDFISGLRSDLNKSYDSFVKKHGQLNSKKNLKLQTIDPDGYNVFALEHVSKEGIKKADIFTRRIISPFVRIDRVDTYAQAIPVVLNEEGHLNMDRMSELLGGKTAEEIMEEAKGAIFMEPSGGYATADEYLSGNVREKLKEAEKAAALDKRFEHNVEKLKEVIPQDLRAVDIEVRIGARWIGPQYYQQFARELFNHNGIKISYFPSSDSFKIDHGYHRTVEITNKYGTSRIDGLELMDLAIQGKTPVVYDYPEGPDGKPKRVLNEKETAAAVEKYNMLRDAFKDWIWKDEDRRNVLGRIYNDKFNSVVKRKYDGSHLTFPGLSHFTPKQHQRDGVWMLLQNNGGIIDHLVGAGKTLLMQAFAIEGKRMGIFKKPAIIALKSTIPQIADSFSKTYPLAKILAPKASDFDAKNRKAFLAKIANNDYDCIIMSHENYAKIQHDPNIETDLINEELDLLDQDIEDLKEAGGQVSKSMMKGLITRKLNLQARLGKLKDMNRDTELRTFQELGIDHLIVDESQQFKNLSYTTKMNGVAGLGKAEGSKRAFNLLIGIRSLQQLHRGDKGTSFFSGTPISNSIVEMYLLLKYLRPRKLDELGMKTFDSWVTTFASASAELEFAVTGALATKNRFREFVNVPELAMLYNEIADVRTSQNLKLPRPEFKKSYTLSFPDDIELSQLPEPGAIYSLNGNKFKIYAAQQFMKGKYDIRGTYIDKPENHSSDATTLTKISGTGPATLNPNGLHSSDYIIKNVKQSKQQQDYTKRIIDFARTKDGKKLGIAMDDNKKKAYMLIATDLSSKLAIDMRLIFPHAQDNPTGKLAVAADTILEHYKESDAHKGTQLVFSDKGTPSTGSVVDDLYDVLQDNYGLTVDELRLVFGESEKKPPVNKVIERMKEVMEYSEEKIEGILQETRAKANSFNIYSDLKAKLIQRGIPAHEIAFIHDYKSDKAKGDLFDQVNEGKIRVLLGSTQKLGTGVNVQEKIVAMHHIDVPWRPSDMEQRNGRGIRQGNILARDHFNNEVPVYAYATEQTLDAYKYQLLATKQYYIDQLKSGAISDRIVNEQDDEEGMGLQEMVAILSGNPDILENAKLVKQVQTLETSKKNFDQGQFDAQASLRRNQNSIERNTSYLTEAEKDLATINANAELDKDGDPIFKIKLFDNEYTKNKEAGKAIIDNHSQFLKIPKGQQRKIGTYLGLDVIAEGTSFFKDLGRGQSKEEPDYMLFLKGARWHRVTKSMDEVAQGVAFKHAAFGINNDIRVYNREINDAKTAITSLNEVLQQKWGKDEELNKLKQKQVEVQRRLNEAANLNPEEAPARNEFGFYPSFDHSDLENNVKHAGTTMEELFNVESADKIKYDSKVPGISVPETPYINGQPYTLRMFRDIYGNKTFTLAPENIKHNEFFNIKSSQTSMGANYGQIEQDIVDFDKKYGEGEYKRLNDLIPASFQLRIHVPEEFLPESDEVDLPEGAVNNDDAAEDEAPFQRNSTTPELTKEQATAIQSVLSKTFPGVKSEYHLTNSDYLKAVRGAGITGTIPTAFIDRSGMIHYAPGAIHSDSQLHENGHILAAWANKYVPSMYQQMLKYGREAKDVQAELKASGYNLDERRMNEEAFVTMLGREGANQVLSQSIPEKGGIIGFIKGLWTEFERYVAEKTGFSLSQMKQIKNMTVSEFINHLNKKYLLSGVPVKGQGFQQSGEVNQKIEPTDYSLDATQLRTADKIIKAMMKGADVVEEMKKVENAFQAAKATLTDPADIQELTDSHNEFKRYLFDSVLDGKIEKILGSIDLGLTDMTFADKFKQAIPNRFHRAKQVQDLALNKGVKVTEENDMLNWADRWRSIASAKIDDILKKVGLSQVDILAWKGRQLLRESIFDRMAKDGMDLEKFGNYLYALHAPERNAKNAQVRRDNFEVKLINLQDQVTDAQADYQNNPSPANKAKLTKLEKELNLYQEYKDVYEDPNHDEKYLKVLESSIDKRIRLMDDGGSGMTNAEAAKIVADIQADPNFAKYDEYNTEVKDNIVMPILDKQLEYGFITQDSYDLIRATYQHYVPLKVDDTFFGDDGDANYGTSIPSAKLYKSKGADYIKHESRVNPLVQSIMDIQAVIYNGEQNHYRQVAAKLAKDAPDYKVWQVQSARFSPVQDRNGKLLAMQEINPPQNAIGFYENGVKKYLVINDEALLKTLEETNVTRAIPILAKINSFFRSVYTVNNPEFQISNALRDIQEAGFFISATQKGDVIKNFVANMPSVFSAIRGVWRDLSGKDVGTWTELAKEYRDLGGEMTWFKQDATHEQIKDIENFYEKYKASGLFEDGKKVAYSMALFMNKFSTAIENATRLNVYKSAKDAGIEKYKAVELARNATINFNKKGTWAPAMDSMYLFYNAAIQGNANLLRVASTKYGKVLLGGLFTIGFLQSMFNNLMSDCENPDHPEDCYDNVRDYEKDKYMVFKIPGAHGFLKIPASYGFGFVYNMGERTAQALVYNKMSGSKFAASSLASLFNAFNPIGSSETPLLQQIAPTAVDPVVQYSTNKDAFGRPIRSDFQFDHRPDSQKGTSKDSKFSTELAGKLNSVSGGNEKIKGKIDIAPGDIDFLLETTTGGVGKFFSRSYSTGSALMNGEASELPMKDVPILNRFYSKPSKFHDKAFIFDTMDDSYNKVLSPETIDKFRTQVEEMRKDGTLDDEKANKYIHQVELNQFKTNNVDLFNIIDRTKTEKLDRHELKQLRKDLTKAGQEAGLSNKTINYYIHKAEKNSQKNDN